MNESRTLNCRFIIHAILIFIFWCSPMNAFAQQFLPRIEPPTLEPPPEPPSTETRVSVITVPVSVSLREIFQQVENETAREVDQSQSWIREGGKGIKYRLWREPLTIELKQFLVSTTLHNHYWLKSRKGLNFFQPLAALVGVFTRRSCGNQKKPLEIYSTIHTNFKLSEWDIQTKTQSVTCTACRCEVPITFKNSEAVSAIRNLHETQVHQASGLLESSLNRISFRPSAEAAWDTIQKPVQLDSIDNQWLFMEPDGVDIEPVIGEQENIVSTIRVFVKPSILPNTENSGRMKSALPDPRRRANVNGFFVSYNNMFPYYDATEDLEDKIVGNEFETLGKTIQITAAVISASGATIVVKVRTAGNLSSTLYLMGQLQADGNEIKVANLDFTAETKQMLRDHAADWLISTNLRHTVGEAAKWNLQPRVEKTRDKILAGLNRQIGSDRALIGTIPNQTFLDVFGGANGFVIPTLYEGTAQLRLQSKR